MAGDDRDRSPAPRACTRSGEDAATQRLADREAIEQTLARANLGFEMSDYPDLFASAFAADAVYELDGAAPVFGYAKMRYDERGGIGTIITDRLERARTAGSSTTSS